MNRLTVSALSRLELCPPSGALPGVEFVDPQEARDRGKAAHAFVQAHYDHVPLDKALLAAPEKYREEFSEMNLEAFPSPSDGWFSEVKIAWNPHTGESLLLKSKEHRDYSEAPLGWLAGTIDLMAWDATSVIVFDLKTGRSRLDSPEEALQLLGYAVALAAATGKSRAIVGWIRLIDGEPKYQWQELDEWALDAAAVRIRQVLERVPEKVDPETTPLTYGEHCTYCPAFLRCPAQMSLATAAFAMKAPVKDSPDAILAEAWKQADALDAIVKAIREAVSLRVKSGPLSLGGGLELQAVAVGKRSIDFELGFAELYATFGPEKANAAIKTTQTLTQEGIKRALGDDAKLAIARLDAKQLMPKKFHTELKTRKVGPR